MSGEELKRLRLKYNLTQTQLGEYLGCHKTRITTWETGKYKISVSYLRLIKMFFAEKGETLD